MSKIILNLGLKLSFRFIFNIPFFIINFLLDFFFKPRKKTFQENLNLFTYFIECFLDPLFRSIFKLKIYYSDKESKIIFNPRKVYRLGRKALIEDTSIVQTRGLGGPINQKVSIFYKNKKLPFNITEGSTSKEHYDNSTRIQKHREFYKILEQNFNFDNKTQNVSFFNINASNSDNLIHNVKLQQLDAV